MLIRSVRDQYATLDNFQFQSTFTKQYATNYVTYALLTDDQLPLKGNKGLLLIVIATSINNRRY